MKSSVNFWGEEHNIPKVHKELEAFDYSQIDLLSHFEGTHPKVMQNRIERMNWMFDFDIKVKRLSFKNRVKMAIEKLTGWRIGEYRNYNLVN